MNDDPVILARIVALLEALEAESRALRGQIEAMCATMDAVADRLTPPRPKVTAEQARNIAHGHKALADQFAEAGDMASARRHEREAERWAAFAP